jgi:septal ring factor EnvC (AmiA/AmiB activator)
VNGRRIDSQIQETRPSWDIESERDFIYQSQMAIFHSQNALYQQYQKTLAAWQRQDSERRKQLTERRNELEKQMSQARAELEQVEGERKANVGGNGDIKKAITLLKQELQAFRDVLQAAERGKPQFALRTHRIDPWLISEEKNRLLRLCQDQIKL